MLSFCKQPQVNGLGVGDSAEILHRGIQAAVLGPRPGRTLRTEPFQKAYGTSLQVNRIDGGHFPEPWKPPGQSITQAHFPEIPAQLRCTQRQTGLKLAISVQAAAETGTAMEQLHPRRADELHTEFAYPLAVGFPVPIKDRNGLLGRGTQILNERVLGSGITPAAEFKIQRKGRRVTDSRQGHGPGFELIDLIFVRRKQGPFDCKWNVVPPQQVQSTATFIKRTRDSADRLVGFPSHAIDADLDPLQRRDAGQQISQFRRDFFARW